MRKIVAIVGMAGSGKSEVSDYFVKKGYSYIRLGQITLDEVKKRGLLPTEKYERQIREGLRKKYGMAAFAKLNIPKIDKLKGDIIIDGLYSWEEYLEFKKNYKNIIILAVYASPKTRYERLTNRAFRHGKDENLKFRSFTKEETRDRDKAEIENLNKGGSIAMADFTIVNEGTKLNLLKNLNNIFRRINA